MARSTWPLCQRYGAKTYKIENIDFHAVILHAGFTPAAPGVPQKETSAKKFAPPATSQARDGLNRNAGSHKNETIRIRPASVSPLFIRERGALLTWRQILIVAFCAACISPAQAPAQTDDEPVYDLGPGVSSPRVVKQVNPQYPNNRGVRAVGSVIIALVVSSKGLPKDPHVVKGLDKDLDESAVDAVKEWRFAPALKDGKAIAVRVSVQLEFHSM
jgi:TonB family protein